MTPTNQPRGTPEEGRGVTHGGSLPPGPQEPGFCPQGSKGGWSARCPWQELIPKASQWVSTLMLVRKSAPGRLLVQPGANGTQRLCAWFTEPSTEPSCRTRSLLGAWDRRGSPVSQRRQTRGAKWVTMRHRSSMEPSLQAQCLLPRWLSADLLTARTRGAAAKGTAFKFPGTSGFRGCSRASSLLRMSCSVTNPRRSC